MNVTLAPCAPAKPNSPAAAAQGSRAGAILLEIAQAMSDACDGHPVRVLGIDGREAAVVGILEDDIELF